MANKKDKKVMADKEKTNEREALVTEQTGSVHMEKMEQDDGGGNREIKIGKMGPFNGPVVTAANRRMYLNVYATNFIKSHQEEYPDLNAEELMELALLYAKRQIVREQKHLKAYLKGKAFYKYRKAMIPVLKPVNQMGTGNFAEPMQMEYVQEVESPEPTDEVTIHTPGIVKFESESQEENNTEE